MNRSGNGRELGVNFFPACGHGIGGGWGEDRLMEGRKGKKWGKEGKKREKGGKEGKRKKKGGEGKRRKGRENVFPQPRALRKYAQY